MPKAGCRIPGSQDPGRKVDGEKIFGSIRIDPSFGAMVLRGSGPQVSRTPFSRFPENRFPDRTGARIEFTGKLLDGSVRLVPRYQKLVVKPKKHPNSFFLGDFGVWGVGGQGSASCLGHKYAFSFHVKSVLSHSASM